VIVTPIERSLPDMRAVNRPGSAADEIGCLSRVHAACATEPIDRERLTRHRRVVSSMDRNGGGAIGLRRDERVHHEADRCRHPGSLRVAPKLRSRRLFETTKNDENAMAAPATSGLRSPAAAMGIAAML
jgi:hypothetical protein